MACYHNKIPRGSKICWLSRLNIWRNLLGPVSKIETVIKMKVDRKKGICTDFGRKVLDSCRDDRDELPLVDPNIYRLPRHIQYMTCHNLVLILLEFIIQLIKRACHRILLTNIDHILCKNSRPSVTLKWDLNPSYTRNYNHLEKSLNICRYILGSDIGN